MRFTLDPGGDVDVPDGATLGRCRTALARLTGARELIDAALTVDGTPLPDDHVAGAEPWVTGSVLSLRRTFPDPVRRATAAPWHVAVVAGPDAGLVAVPGPDGAVVVARRGAEVTHGSPPGRLELTDPTVSRSPVTVRRTGGRRRWVRWRVSGRPVRAGQAVVVGESTLVVRGPAPEWAHEPAPEPEAPPTGVEPGATPSPQASAPSSGSGSLAAARWAPVLASAGLAVALRNPVFLLLAAAGPLAVVVPLLGRRLRTLRRPAPLCEPLLGSDAALTAVRAAAGTLPPEPAWWPLAREGLAVVGTPAARQAVARVLVGSAVADRRTQICLLTAHRWSPAWTWCRWAAVQRLPDGSAGAVRGASALEAPLAPDGRRLVLAEEAHHERTHLHRWWMRRRPGQDAVVLLEAAGAPLPAWCGWVLHVAEDVHRLEGPGGTTRVEGPSGSLAWAEAHARRALGLRLPERAEAPGAEPATDPPGALLPRRVGLADLLPAEVEDVVARWSDPGVAGEGSLAVPLGLGGAGPVPQRVEVDLLSDGPHALVAGTTGAGKSELLQTWLLGLALRHPPTALTLVLIDYKGGASFGPCADLPHVAGRVTDLDVVEAARALDGLRAELVRRERLLGEQGVADIESLRRCGAPVPPRLVVVVDEFRTLSEELPDFVPGLVRLAAQGRSLGIHLVLATQRPAGAVSAQMRANLTLRICLRVADATDSTDVVEVPDAAALPADRPGLALVRRGPAAPELLQTAWAALPPGTWRPPSADGAVCASWAPEWSTALGPDAAAGGPGTAGPGTAGPGTPRREIAPTDWDHARALVEVCRRAARSTGCASPAQVWLPPLPTWLPGEDLPDDEEGLPLGMTDLPAVQDRGVLLWSSGVLVVAGRPGSGRSTALRTAGAAALRRRWCVHLVEGARSPDRAWCSSGTADHPRLGTVVGADDPRRLARLLTLLARPAPSDRTVLLVDDVGAVERALELLPRGAGAGMLEALLREARHRGLAVAVAGAPADVVRLLPHATDRLVLAVNDPSEDVMLGVPRAFAGGRAVPGRGVHLGPAGPLRCQVARPLRSPGLAGPPLPRAGRPLAPAGPCLRLAPLPLVAQPSPDGPTSWHPSLGIGGDSADVVRVDVRRGVLVVGPARSGRSTALLTLAHGLRAAGHTVVDAGRTGSRGHLLGVPPGSVVVIDDLDLLTRADPETDDLLHRWVSATEAGDTTVPLVLAAARTDRAATAYRGGLAALRGGSSLVVLSPAAPGSADVAGVDLGLAVDPVRPWHPGRGVLVEGGRLTPVQVAVPGPKGQGGGAAGQR